MNKWGMRLILVGISLTSCVLWFLMPQNAFGQNKRQKSKSQVIHISEPATTTIQKLYVDADLVAFVEIRSGDSEHYRASVYKAEVTRGFKGTKEKDLIYFGNFTGYRIGYEYLVFLQKTDKTLGGLKLDSQKTARGPFSPQNKYFQIMYEGYSVMPVEYECIFDGKVAERCDYGVKFNIYQVNLPGVLKTYPQEDSECGHPYWKWVRRTQVEAFLSEL